MCTVKPAMSSPFSIVQRPKKDRDHSIRAINWVAMSTSVSAIDRILARKSSERVTGKYGVRAPYQSCVITSIHK